MTNNHKKIWITGASSGIGKSVAEKFASHNWKVAVSARREDILNQMSSNLNITNIKVISDEPVECLYPYSLDDDNWKQIQMEGLKSGYKSRSVR